MQAEKYDYTVTWSEEDQEYVGRCREFPSLSWLESTQAGALNGIVKLVESVLDEMLASNEIPPEPFSKRRYSGKFQVRISSELHRELDRKSSDKKMSINRLVNDILARNV